MSEGTAVVPTRQGAALASDNTYDLVGGKATFWSSLPQTTTEEIGALFARMQERARPIAECIGEVIEIEHVIAHGVELPDADGVVTEQPRIVLIAPDGSAVQCVSKGILNSLRTLIQMLGITPQPGQPLFTPALRAKVQQFPTGNNRRTYTLIPQFGAAAEKGKKGRA